MLIKAHLVFFRNEYHIQCKVDQHINQLIGNLDVSLGKCPGIRSFEIKKHIPSTSEMKETDLIQYHYSPFLPRIWIDIYVIFDTNLSVIQIADSLADTDNKAVDITINIFDTIQQSINLSILTGNIANAGSLSFLGGKFYLENICFTDFEEATNTFAVDFLTGYKYDWPQFIEVTHEDVLKWLKKQIKPNTVMSNSKTTRAIAAFSNLIFQKISDESSLNIFWALMGLEAFFCKGKEGLKQQIFEKSQLVLGEVKDYKKEIKQMYDIRSELIHGVLDLPYSFNENLESKEWNTFNNKIYSASLVAIKMLIVTFQYMVKNNIEELDFIYKLHH